VILSPVKEFQIMGHSTTIPLHVSPSVRKALRELDTLLEDYHYSPHARGQIVAHTAREGTPTGCAYLDREDEADASMVFESELEPVPYDSDVWDRDTGVLFDAAMLAEGNHPWPLVQDCSDDRTIPPDADLLPPELDPDDDDGDLVVETIVVRPVCGGSEEAEPYEPTAEDLRDYSAWSAELDARRNAVERSWREMIERSRAWYAANPLAEFNRLRTD
jgi:hypothetical protein